MNSRFGAYILVLIYIQLILFHSVECCRFEKRFADLDSGRTFYTINEGDSRKRIVFVHGLLGDSFHFSEWRCIFSYIGYQVLAYDLLGHGQTEWKLSGFFSQERFVAQLNDLLKNIGWVNERNEAENKFTLLGVSMGGLISAKYALTYPSHLSNLILMCPPGMMSKDHFPSLYKLSKSEFVGLVKNIHSSKRVFKCGLNCAKKLGFVKMDKVPKEQKESVTEECHRTFSTYVKCGGEGSLFDRYSDFEDLSKHENSINIVFFWGIKDRTVPLAPAVEFLSQHFNKTPIVVYPFVRHIPNYPLLSPALVTLDFLELNTTIGVPLGTVKNINYFYDNEVNIINGINFTFQGDRVEIKYNTENYTQEYLDFNITSSS
ncbi:secreted protein of the alpha beta hydrolase superfamily [Cryptosporidium canis]|nr:secreted protein of the alpha beta hydrolase superfamily [Cryptosporidium canis]